ncbi:MAG TPA: PD-(D/E)XK nuclease family protein, partial [Nannocystaceae bacterium]|nr:PD-(D/E)XK nuclease family protein [Nannocystaceae bacterium]
TSWTQARALLEAAVGLERTPGLLDDAGHFLAVVTIDTAPVIVRLIRAIPTVDIVLLAARPLRARTIERMSSMLGEPVRDALLRTHVQRAAATDLGIVTESLFESEGSHALLERVHAGTEPDGTLSLEEYDGVSAEIDAAVDWVARQILAGTALDRIAILAPAADPWSSLLASALRSLATHDLELPIEVEGGSPVAHTAAGARVHALLHALEHHLAADALVDVLASVNGPDASHVRPSRARVFDLVHSLGTRGGSAADPERAFEWRTKLDDAARRLSTPTVHDGFSDQEEYIERRRVRLLATLKALAPAILALCELAEAISRSASLVELRPLLVGFIRDHLVQPTLDVRVASLLDARLELLATDPSCGRTRGTAVLRMVRTVAAEIRLPSMLERGGVYVGTVQGAAGLAFDAVRIIGLSEGSIPPTVRGDPVLPDDLRARVSPVLEQGVDRAAAPLHDFDMIVRGARARLSLSAPRLAIDRTVREPSSLFVEVGAALGRTAAAGRVPSLAELRRTEIRSALEKRERLRRASPLRAIDWHDRLAAGIREVPSSWRVSPATDLLALASRAPLADAWHPLDGMLAEHGELRMAGIDAARPTSAWRLSTLLTCPHRFLFEHVLDWYEPPSTPPGHELDPATFGGLVHAVAERFFREHGPAFARRDESLEHWRDCAHLIAATEVDTVLETYGLDSRSASSAVRRKLVVHVDRLLAHSWGRDSRRFVATEWAFGATTPVRLPLEGGELFVRGRIDLVEADASSTFVADIKTGKCRPRRGTDFEPTPRIDLQIGIYQLVIAEHSDVLELPRQVGAGYVHTDDRKGSERCFIGADSESLRTAALDWLETARGLLASRTFPRTPDHSDCRFCPFGTVCSNGDRRRSAELLQRSTDPTLVRFRTLKGQS